MLKKLLATIAIILLIPAFAYARSAESSAEPDRLQKSRGKVLYRYNIQQVQEDLDGDGQMETMYHYEEVIIEPPVTKAKVLAALRNEESSDDVTGLETERTQAQQRLAQIADLTYAQADQYVDNNVTDLASAKALLKKLAKAIIALSRQLDL